MFATTSHPYLLQVAALWFSFLPAAFVLFLIAGAQFERFRRHGMKSARQPSADAVRLLASAPKAQFAARARGEHHSTRWAA